MEKRGRGGGGRSECLVHTNIYLHNITVFIFIGLNQVQFNLLSVVIIELAKLVVPHYNKVCIRYIYSVRMSPYS